MYGLVGGWNSFRITFLNGIGSVGSAAGGVVGGASSKVSEGVVGGASSKVAGGEGTFIDGLV